MKKALYVLLSLVCVVLLACSIFFAISFCARNRAKTAAITCFQENRLNYEKVLNDMHAENDLLQDILDLSAVHRHHVPESLSEVGIEEIYSDSGNVYFEFSDDIMGITPYGILYVVKSSKIDEWYRTEKLDGSWYYYRIVS